MKGKNPFSFISVSAFVHASVLLGLVMMPALKLIPRPEGQTVEISTDTPAATHLMDDPSTKVAPAVVQKPNLAQAAQRVEAPAQKVEVVKHVSAAKKVARSEALPAKLNKTKSIDTAAVVDDSALTNEVTAADQQAREYANEQRDQLKQVDAAPAKALDPEDEVIDQAAQVAADEAVTKQDEAEKLPAPKTNPPAERMSQMESKSAANGANAANAASATASSNGPASGEEVRSYLDLKQMGGNRPPQYPEVARRSQIQGEVVLNYFVTNQGSVKEVKIAKSSGSRDLDQEAVRAISKFRYVPGQEGWTEHPVVFALKGAATPASSRLRTAGQSGRGPNDQ